MSLVTTSTLYIYIFKVVENIYLDSDSERIRSLDMISIQSASKYIKCDIKAIKLLSSIVKLSLLEMSTILLVSLVDCQTVVDVLLSDDDQDGCEMFPCDFTVGFSAVVATCRIYVQKIWYLLSGSVCCKIVAYFISVCY